MNCFDMCYYPSGGEGFGNPVAEMMACKVPLVFSNYSSHAEFAKFGGLPVRVSYIPEIHHAIQRAIVDNNHAVEQILKLVEDPSLRDNLGEAGRSYIGNYALQNMTPAWDMIFTSMMSKQPPIKNGRMYGGLV